MKCGRIGVTAFGEKLPDLVNRARYAELLDAIAEGVRVKAEDLGGAAGAGDQPVGLLEDLQDVVAFHVLQARLARGR